MVSSVRPPGRPIPDPPKHVIDEYRHRDQHVRCICGWEGSSAPRAVGSDWGDHVALMRRVPATVERKPTSGRGESREAAPEPS